MSITTPNVKPTITYGHGQLWDGEDVDGWDSVPNSSTVTFSIADCDFFDFCISSYVGDAYWVNHDALALNTDIYTKIRWRYKTSDSNVKAKIVLYFSGGDYQVVLANSSSITCIPGVATITPNKILSYVRFYVDAAAGHVYIDYALIYKGDFSFPNSRDGIELRLPVDDVVQKPIGMSGALTDGFGSNLLEYDVQCDLTKGTWTRSGDQRSGEVFLEIAHRSNVEAWQWFNSGLEQMKVRISNLRIPRQSTPLRMRWGFMFTLREYRLSDAGIDAETYRTRWGLDQAI